MMRPRRSRNSAYRLLLGMAIIALIGASAVYPFQSGLPLPVSSSGSSTLSSFNWNDPVLWQRPIRLRTLSATGWDAAGYTANQILGMLSELKPTMLQRYTSGDINFALQVPVCGGCAPMTVTQFLQASENASGGVIVARISINEYDLGTFFTTSQNLLSVPINPPIRILSIDDWNGWIKIAGNAALWPSISAQLFAQGWVWLETGGPGSSGTVLNGTTNYASVEFNQVNNFIVTSSAVKAWTSKPGIQHILASMSFPTDIAYLQSLATTDSAQLAAIFANVAANQTSVGYKMIYFILQGKWDTNQIVITSGPYSGMTLYQEMKSLMARYSVVSTVPDFTVTVDPPNLIVHVNSSGSGNIELASMNNFSGTLSLTTRVSPLGPSASLSLTTLTLGPGATASSNLTVSTTTTPPGLYDLAVNATGGSISHIVHVSLTVSLNNPPVLKVPGLQNVATGSRLTFTVSATDLDLGETLTLAVRSLPPGATFNSANRTFSWIPTPTQVGTYNVTFTVKDNGSPILMDNKFVTIQVQTVPAPPPPGQPPSQTTCSWCNVVPKMGTTTWLFTLGALAGMVASLTVIYLKAQSQLANAREMRRLAQRRQDD